MGSLQLFTYFGYLCADFIKPASCKSVQINVHEIITQQSQSPCIERAIDGRHYSESDAFFLSILSPG